MSFRYSNEHISFLKGAATKWTVDEITEQFNVAFGLGKSRAEIVGALKKRKIHLAFGRGRYAPEQLTFLREGYAQWAISELTARYNEKFSAKKTKKQISLVLEHYNYKSGRDGGFVKGMVAYIPPWKKEIGEEVVRKKRGQTWIKVEGKNPYTGSDSHFVQTYFYMGKSLRAGTPRQTPDL